VETSGSVDLYRLPKLKYYFYQSQADGKPFIYAIHDGVSKLIVFSNCDAIELTRSGKFLGRQTPDNGPDTAYGKEGSPGWETALPGGFDQTGGEPFNGGCASQMKHPPFTFFNVEPPKPGEDIWLNGIIGKKKVTDFLVRKPGTPKKVKSRLRTEGVNPTVGDLIFVDAILLDDHDMIVPVSIPMKLELSGDAEIVGGMKTSEAGIASWLIRVKGKDFAVKKIHLQF